MTLTDLYRNALEKLRIIAAGEDVQPDDNALIADKYAAVYGMLQGKHMVAWSATDEVPEYAVIPLTAMIAWASAREFGKDPSAYAIEGAIDLPIQSQAERQLQKQLARAYVSYPAQSDYF